MGTPTGGVTLARRTIRTATEALCRALQAPIHIRQLVRQVVESLGIEERRTTEASVREVLGRLRWMVAAGRGWYVPARLALDGKAIRLRPPSTGWGRMLPLWQLEPLSGALEDAAVTDSQGRPLPRDVSVADADRLRREAAERARRQATEIVDFFLAEASRQRPLSPQEIRQLIDELLERAAEERGNTLDRPAATEQPYLLPDEWDDQADLVVRYHAASHSLRVSPEAPADRDEARIEEEDRRFCDFVVSRLRSGYSVPLHGLVLEAYAQLPGFGDYPGSPPHLAVRRDPRIYVVTRGSSSRVDDITNPALARADDIALLGQLQRRRADTDAAHQAANRQRRVHLARMLPERIRQHLRELTLDLEEVEQRLGLGEDWPQPVTQGRARTDTGLPVPDNRPVQGAGQLPANEAVLARWETALRQQGLSDRVRARKIGHLEVLAQYLASGRDFPPIGLLEAAGVHLTTFFFGTYVLRFPCSPTDAQTFTQDVRDFYRWAEEQGLVPDSRFAEVPYRLRRHVAERIRLYVALDPDEPDWEPLFEALFTSGPL